MSSRVPLRKWMRPTQQALKGKVYHSGRPKFYPFPTVTNLINATLCPVAVLHDLLHGVDWAAISSPQWLQGEGNLFHDFTAFLKSLIIKEELQPTGVNEVRYEYISWARRIATDARDRCWNHYLEPWSRRKFEELLQIDRGARIFFEIFVANAYVDFPSGKSSYSYPRTYPLRGKIDEIDIDNKKLIERTIKGRSSDENPPRLKDYQLWLLWKILCSVPSSDYPEQWKGTDFSDFDLVVETPFKDFLVDKDNPKFADYVHDAYTWIYDLSFDRRAIWEAYQSKNCTFSERDDDCGLLSFCYRRRQPYPTCRSEMRRVFRDMYRPMLWERMWNWHLFQYQLVMLADSDLEHLGLISKGEVVTSSEERITIKVPKKLVGPIIASGSGIGRYLILPFGTFLAGKRMQATLEQRKENLLTMKVPKKEIPTSRTILILPVETDLPILKSRPWYLTKVIQRDMFSLEYFGAKNPDKASSDSVVQLIESIFGRKALRRERNDSG